MSGIKELSEIMRNLNPILSEEDYVFCSFHNLTAGSRTIWNDTRSRRQGRI